MGTVAEACLEERHVRRAQLPTGELIVSAGPGAFSLDELIGFAARANPKRGFLFLSKVLGKHWPVAPATMLRIHRWLAGIIPAEAPPPIAFIGLAETATGLGQGVFEAYLEANPDAEALYMHTTRYRVPGHPFMEFAETHSHAPRQFLHLPANARLLRRFRQARTLVLVDDEVSTGNTLYNLAAACRRHNPGIERVYLATIVDLRDETGRGELGRRIGLCVTTVSALTGEYRFRPQGGAPRVAAPLTPAGLDREAECRANGAFGRSGIGRRLAAPRPLAERLAQEIGPGEGVLVLGTGEFMHPAFLLARALEDRGHAVRVQATTRSPILCWGAVREALSFADNYGEGIPNYLYNVAAGQYRHVFICHETPPAAALCELAHRLHGRLLHFRKEDDVVEIPVR